MVMPNFLDKLLVKTPAYNIFQYPRVHNKLDLEIGRNIPVKYLELHAGEECDIKFSQLTRFMPMVNPIFHQVNLEFIPFFVPFRLLKDFGFDGENYFNPATPDSERVPMPMITPKKLYSRITRIMNSIWDYLRYPTFSFLIRTLASSQKDWPFKIYVKTGSSSYSESTIDYNGMLVLNGDNIPIKVKLDYYNSNAEGASPVFTLEPLSFFGWLTQDMFGSEAWNIIPEYGVYSGNFDWDEYFERTGKRPQQAYDEYYNYLHLELVKSHVVDKDDSNDQPLSLLPWLCYVRLIYDWFINTGVSSLYDRIPSMVSMILDDISAGEDFVSSLDDSGLSSSDGTYKELSYFLPYVDFGQGVPFFDAFPSRSLWQRDYFTGAFVSSQSGDAVPIPANGTIPDLAGARKLQWFRTLNLFGGRRFIDQIFAHRGVKSSDARLDRCEVIGEKKSFRLQISDVLQTSQSDIDSSLGDFAGHGISYAGDHLCHYRAEEPGLVMVIARVRPSLEYIDNVPRLLLKSDYYDFENPEFDNVGMQPILNNEIQYGHGSDWNNTVFAWTRRYAEYMTDTSECHGSMQTSLANWHMARAFDNGHPVFNTRFGVIQADGRDDLNRVFSNPGYKYPVLMDITWDIQVSRPLSKVVEFDF